MFAAWQDSVSTALGKFAEDIILLAQTGTDEIKLKNGGASSTMPQKQNPAKSSVSQALSHQAVVLSATMQKAALHT